MEMRVTKRDGRLEIVAFDKILKRIKQIGSDIKINYTTLAMKVIDQLYDAISSTKIDELCAEQCASMASIHPDYSVLAGRISISNHHCNTSASFVEVVNQLYNYKDNQGNPSPLISDELFLTVNSNRELFETMCDYTRDYLIDYFGFKTLERSYLMRIDGKVVERPQHMWLRVAIGIHSNIAKIRETYNGMSNKYFTHATPTLYNAGTPHPQLSSCYLLAMESDSIDGIYNTLKDCALISKWAGGIGLHIHNVRATGSHIRGTNGSSNGIVPMLRVFNNTAKYVDQCVLPDTLVYTSKGPIQIAQCISGITEVFNRTGKETIKTVLEYAYTGIVYEIKVNGVILKITPEHPILVANFGHDAKWVEAKKVVMGDYIAFSVPTQITDFAELTEEVCFIYGIITTGIVLHNSFIKYKNEFTVFLKPAESQILCNYFAKHNVRYTQSYSSQYNKITWDKTVNLPFNASDFYQTFDANIIGERWLFLPHAKTQRILDGLNNFVNVKKYIQFMELRLRTPTNGLILAPIESITIKQYTGAVFDLQMSDEHNYLLESGLVHNGGGRRHGSFAIYLEPWHADVELFLEMRKNHGDEELKARDLFYALWIPDLFMERVKSGGKWTLMCPDECPGLADVYGDEFVALYTKYETTKTLKAVNARDLWFKILDAQMETGTPYILYKDAANRKSNQKNLGTIKSSNLCTEIIEYSDQNETAVCNLASLALPMYIANGEFDFDLLHEVAKIVTYNLNRVIDVNFYPTEKTRLSNLRHRPIGIGVQGLADVFILLGLPFVSDKARQLNKDIFETIYHAALECSNEIARERNEPMQAFQVEFQQIANTCLSENRAIPWFFDTELRPIGDEMKLTGNRCGAYSSFEGSPAAHGILQFDLWDVEPSARYDWQTLKADIKEYGIRNSLLVAPMPTASTSQILGYNECIEPITSNIYSRRTLAGEFIMANKYLIRDLIALGLWDEKMKNTIIENNGSVQQITSIPADIREKYLTVWEMPMRSIIDMAADRGAYICQSQSLNLWIEDPTYNSLTSMHFYSWSKGLKTGIYYLRRRAKHQAQQFTIEPKACEMCSA